jgi:uncharacterized protein DUF4159
MNGRAGAWNDRARARARNGGAWARAGARNGGATLHGMLVALVMVVGVAALAASAIPMDDAVYRTRPSVYSVPTPTPSREAATPRREALQENTEYNGQFVFVRLRYADGMGGTRGFGRRGRGPGWYHDYPDAEQNITRLLAHLTKTVPGVIGGNIIEVGDPELHRYPIAYMSEPGDWGMTDEEVANLRSYVLKGGFLIFDDFPYEAWSNFEAQMKRILPELQAIELKADHRIFNIFFEFESLDNLYGSYQGRPYFFGYFLDNDPGKRMVAMVNYVNDLGESWEYAERGFSVIGDAAIAEAYKFGINYLLYGLVY